MLSTAHADASPVQGGHPRRIPIRWHSTRRRRASRPDANDRTPARWSLVAARYPDRPGHVAALGGARPLPRAEVARYPDRPGHVAALGGARPRPRAEVARYP